MHVRFESSHVAGDFSSGRLTVRIDREVDDGSWRDAREIFFETPPDFHTHNDSVAAALMTLVGSRFTRVTFNFPVSSRCAELLSHYYRLEEVTPVDPDLEPRRRGRYLGLLLSGGLDSLAIWCVLRRVLGDEFKVITGDYGRAFGFEARGYRSIHRHVTCRTDLRLQGVFDGPPFVFAPALLYADYADLGVVTTGHHFAEIPLSIDFLRDGSRPSFLDADRALHAGGLDGMHIARALNTVGLMKLGMLAGPELQEGSWHATGPSGSFKLHDKGLTLRYLYERQFGVYPAWLADITPPRGTVPFRDGQGMRFFPMYLVRHLGLAPMRRNYHDIDCYDLDFLDDMSLGFMERYNSTFIQHIPSDLRAGVLAAFHEAGLEPYAERDWEELDVLRTYNLALNEGRAPRRAGVGCDVGAHSGRSGERVVDARRF